MNCQSVKSAVIFAVILFLSGTCQQPEKVVLQEPSYHRWLEEITIPVLQQGYYEGKFTVREVVMAYLDRIIAIDKNGPTLNSILEINPDALQIADEIDRELSAGKTMGPLFGIPVVLKDNIDTHDRMPTTAGSTALRNSYPLSDSFVAKKLREAGAVIIAKGNLSEWANFRATISSSGWSGIGGQTKNPYVLDRNPCGSSSGSGVAVSANLCMIAIGTETNGSIVCPSNSNGIVGIKPTVGLISRSGIVPISYTQDTPGPMGRSVTDVAICLGALTGIDPADTKTGGSEDKYPVSYTEFLKADGLKGRRLGLYKRAMGNSEMVDTLVNQAVKTIIKMGAEVIEIEDGMGDGYDNASFEVMLYEFKEGLNKYFAGLEEDFPIKSLKELIEFNKTDTIELKYFNQKLLEMAEEKDDPGSSEYKNALRTMLSATREEGIDKIMKEHRLDAIIAPTGTPAWKTDLILGDHFVGGSSSPAAISGYPAITVPMGFIRELPVGITFFGRAWSEPLLIEIAFSYEQATKHRKAPKYLITD
jgi:amidase